MVYSIDLSKAVVPVLVLLFVALWFILRGDLYLVLFCSCVFSRFSIAITSLGEERANLSAYRTFVRSVFVWFYRLPLPLDVWEGLWFVIVALPGLSGLFCYVFFFFFFFVIELILDLALYTSYPNPVITKTRIFKYIENFTTKN